MNSTPAAASEFRIFSPVCPRPPSGPSLASSRLIVGIDTSAANASCSWDQSNSALAALICRIDTFSIDFEFMIIDTFSIKTTSQAESALGESQCQRSLPTYRGTDAPLSAAQTP